VIVVRPRVEGNIVFTTSKIRYATVSEDSWPGPNRRYISTWLDARPTRKTLFRRRTRCRRLTTNPTPLSSRQSRRPRPPVYHLSTAECVSAEVRRNFPSGRHLTSRPSNASSTGVSWNFRVTSFWLWKRWRVLATSSFVDVRWRPLAADRRYRHSASYRHRLIGFSASACLVASG